MFVFIEGQDFLEMECVLMGMELGRESRRAEEVLCRTSRKGAEGKEERRGRIIIISRSDYLESVQSPGKITNSLAANNTP